MTSARIVSVLLAEPLPEPFDYEAPEGADLAPGDLVRAPLGGRRALGCVWSLPAAPPERALRRIEARLDEAPALGEGFRRFLDRAARYVCAPAGTLLSMALRSPEALEAAPRRTLLVPGGEGGILMTDARRRVLDTARSLGPLSPADLAREARVSASVVRGLTEVGALLPVSAQADAPFDTPDPGRSGKTLTAEQEAAAAAICARLGTGSFAPILLDGVTGSGKTEVYFEAIARTLRSDPEAQVLVLLPEIALSQAVISRFTERFGAAPAEWHSAIGQTARRRAWREIAAGRARIIVGARSALFLPCPRLRLIIVDEEHDASYKQEEGVSYQARDLAVMRAQTEGAGILLASATPSLETWANARQGRYARVVLTARPGAARLPEIRIADMRASPPPAGAWISPPLLEEMQHSLSAGEQVLLYLNRRGYAPLVLCRACGEKLRAPDTDSWLTEHRYSGRLVCHLTGFSMPRPAHCPSCGAAGSLVGVGPGVERLMEESRQTFPSARIEVFSSDTTRSPAELRALITRMETGAVDILIGTQIAAKGHNFPLLTLVGVIDADAGLKGGDMRAGERTFQLISQVAGRAGRADRPGRALIQTYDPQSPALECLARGDRDGFLDLEMSVRETLGYPPFGRLGAVIVSAATSPDADEWSRRFAAVQPNAPGVEVWGPAPAPVTVIRGRHRRRFLARSDRHVDLSAFLAAWRSRLRPPSGVRIAIDVEPYQFM